VLVTILMSANLAGDGLRDAFDPGSSNLRQRRTGKRT
jgi:peptide/nickel transport system permease protein